MYSLNKYCLLRVRNSLVPILTLLAFANPVTAAEPLTLSAAIERALAQNYTIQIDSYIVPLAETELLEARGKFDPQLYLSYSDNTNNQPTGTDTQTGEAFPPSVLDAQQISGGIAGELPFGLSYEIEGSASNETGDFPGATSSNFDEYNSGVNASVSVPLLRGFGKSATLNSIRIARANHNISEWELKSSVINTVTNVIYAYHETQLAQANLRSAKRSRELAAQLQAENEQRFKVGSMSEYDVLSAKSRVASREDSILMAERSVFKAINALKQLISDDSTAELLSQSLDLAPLPEPCEIVVIPEVDIDEALENRPDIQQANLRLERNDYDLSYYRNQLLPSVNLVSSYGYNGSGLDYASSREAITDRAFPAYSTGITVSIPFTSASERARYRRARLSSEQALVALRQLEQSIVINIDNAAGQIETAWKRVLATRNSRALSEQALEGQENKLRAGSGRTFDALQLQENLSNAEVREARAISAYRNALAEYDRQLGRTLDAFNIELAEGRQHIL